MAVGRKGKCVNGLSTGQSMASPPYIPNQGPRDRSSTSHPHSSSSRRKSLRLPITVKGNTFIQSECSPAIREIIEATFDAHPDSSWPTWKATPIQTRGMMFDEFAKKFSWAVDQKLLIRRSFNARAACILSSFFGRVRISRSQPEWIGNTHWEHLCAEWDTEEFKKKSRINKANRQKRTEKTLSSREKDSANVQGENNQSLRTSELKKKLEEAILNLATKDRELQQLREENRQTAAVLKEVKEKHEEELQQLAILKEVKEKHEEKLQQLRDKNRQTAAILKEVKEKHKEELQQLRDENRQTAAILKEKLEEADLEKG